MTYTNFGCDAHYENCGCKEQPIMTPTHTPGPWTVVPDGNSGFKIRPVAHSKHDSWTIADVRYQANDDANASLIAAAPALLEALKDAQTKLVYIMERLHENMNGDYPSERFNDDLAGLDNVTELTERAIAQAEGRVKA